MSATRKSAKLVDQGDFEEMIELASELANECGGLIVVHRKYCLEEEVRDDCSCNPIILSPYSVIDESELEGLDN